MPEPRLSPVRIAEAAEVVDPAFRDSPQLTPEHLAERLGFELTVKLETLNPIRSFKGRGTDFLLHRLAAEAPGGDEPPVACVSAGNFGQGLAYAGRRRGREVHVFTAAAANPLKLAAMERFGAVVHPGGADFDAAKDHARAVAATEGWLFVEDGDHPAISEGAGTIGVELARDAPAAYDVVLLPVGNGALAAGVGTWLREHAPGTRLVGVCAAGAPSMHDSWHAGRPVPGDAVATIADGIAIRVPVPAAVGDLDAVLDDVVLVDDASLLSAMALVGQHLGVLAEPSGVAGIAAAVQLREGLAGQRVASVLCGSNIAPEHAWRLPGTD